MTVARYLATVLDGFIRSWWALVTGVGSLLGWLAIPEAGLSLGKIGSCALLLVAAILISLTLNVIIRAYGWFSGASLQPTVLQFVPRTSSDSAAAVCTFVIQEHGWKLLPGHIFGLYRSVQSTEVCISVVKVDRGRHNDAAIQCIPLWIAPVHLKQLSEDPPLARQLIVRREIPESRIADLIGDPS